MVAQVVAGAKNTEPMTVQQGPGNNMIAGIPFAPTPEPDEVSLGRHLVAVKSACQHVVIDEVLFMQQHTAGVHSATRDGRCPGPKAVCTGTD